MDYNGKSLIIAAAICDVRMVQELLLMDEKWMFINYKPYLGDTALHKAVYCNHVSIAKMLLINGADTEVKDGNLLTPLWTALTSKNTQMIQ